MSRNGEKLRIEDLSESDFNRAREIVHAVVRSQSAPASPLGYVALRRITRSGAGLYDGLDVGLNAELNTGLGDELNAELNTGLGDELNAGLYTGLYTGLNAGLNAGLNDGLNAGLNAGLRDGLNAGLRDGLRDGLNAGLNTGLGDELNAGLYAGLHAGLHVGLGDGLYDGLRDGLNAGLHDGLHDGLRNGLRGGLYAGLNAGLNTEFRDGIGAELHAGLHAGIGAGLHAGLHAGLNAGLHDGLRAGLDAGLRGGLRGGLYAGLDAGLYDGLDVGKLEECYCGICWSWWLTRYLIGESLGVPLNKEKLLLMRAFCLLCPIIGIAKGRVAILPKPSNISWRVAGETSEPFRFPVYELHANGRPAVEHPMCRLYYWHNTKIPERMGSVNCEHWKPEWIVDEKNSEVRRVLLHEIGYERAIATLGANVRDKWREYELIELTVPEMPVRYQLLKMTCPSTGDVHVLRVPPDMDTAENAITWVNHGTHPDLFVSQA